VVKKRHALVTHATQPPTIKPCPNPDVAGHLGSKPVVVSRDRPSTVRRGKERVHGAAFAISLRQQAVVAEKLAKMLSC
jgi:hypothetical protein